MIASGGLSGGISSSIAGGNFWDGARQGIITSGLNHLAHSGVNAYQKHRFQVEIDKAFGDMADKPVPVGERNTEGIYKVIEKLPTLKKLFHKIIENSNCYYLEFNDIIPRNGDDGRTYFSIDTRNPSDLMTYIYRGSMSSYRYLTEVIMHEFGHARSVSQGFYYDNVQKYGKYSNFPEWIDEVYAHKYANYHGGFSTDTPYYKRNFNPISKKIDEIVFPSY